MHGRANPTVREGFGVLEEIHEGVSAFVVRVETEVGKPVGRATIARPAAALRGG